MTCKQLGGWIATLGVLSILLSFFGLHFRLLWFLDELGPIVAYALKGAVVVLGVGLFAFGDRSPAVDDGELAEGSGSWIKIALAATVVIGALLFITIRTIVDSQDKRALHRVAPAAAWASSPATNWPPIALLQRAEFKTHSLMEAGCASLIRLPAGEVVALTAGHLLGADGGVRPGFLQGGLGGLDLQKLATLDREIVSWKLFIPEREEQAVRVSGLFGKAKDFDEDCDQLLLRISARASNCPVQPLEIRLKPVAIGEPVHVICFSFQDGDLRQTVLSAKRIPGLLFSCELSEPTDLNGCSGAPVVDKDGLLVAIVTGGTLMDFGRSSSTVRAFSGHTISELLPVLKAALHQKPTS